MADIKMYKKQLDTSKITDYSLFLGGLNATKDSLKQYDPLITGYNRIFLIKMPIFMEKAFPDRTKAFKHMVEYGFTKIDGISGLSMETDPITGGYTGRSLEVATVLKDDTNSINITLYESAGSPVREFITLWMTGISDPYTGLGTYHGYVFKKNSDALKYAQYNHVMEAIYVATDPTGGGTIPGEGKGGESTYDTSAIEYACLLTNMIPKSVKLDHFNYDSGNHNIVQVDLEFTCVKYESPQINLMAAKLLNRYQIMRSFTSFQPGTDYEVTDAKFAPSNIKQWPDYTRETSVNTFTEGDSIT